MSDMELSELEAELLDVTEVMEYEADAIWQSVYVEHKKELEDRINSIIVAVYE